MNNDLITVLKPQIRSIYSSNENIDFPCLKMSEKFFLKSQSIVGTSYSFQSESTEYKSEFIIVKINK